MLRLLPIGWYLMVGAVAVFTHSGNFKTRSKNRFLSHGPRNRLTAEMLRDQALVVSGKHSPKMFGPSVMPPQPDGVWSTVYNSARWVNADGPDRYRRAIYTFWKRTTGYPSMTTFDVPSREVCVGRRVSTNTPLQALVTLNDEAYQELAEGFAERMSTEGGTSLVDQLAWGYRVASGREPSSSVVDELIKLYETVLKKYQKDPGLCKWSAFTSEEAALAVVASTILNLDEVVTK